MNQRFNHNVTSINRDMEPGTIQKNGASPKSRGVGETILCPNKERTLNIMHYGK
jgi:hypothetical protein